MSATCEKFPQLKRSGFAGETYAISFSQLGLEIRESEWRRGICSSGESFSEWHAAHLAEEGWKLKVAHTPWTGNRDELRLLDYFMPFYTNWGRYAGCASAPRWSEEGTLLSVPVGFVGLVESLFAVPLIVQFGAVYSSKRRARAGLCPKCRYDIKALPICPECGTPRRT